MDPDEPDDSDPAQPDQDPDRPLPAVLPMFPLGTVLLPGGALPLHIFEPRYRTMIRQVIDGDGRFGVTLIARGNEVGGGDVRTDIGTVAKVVGANEFPDGRWAVIAVGTSRLRVRQWLPDDPYPQAEVEEFGDDPHAPVASSDAYAGLVRHARRVMALAVEAGQPTAAATSGFAEDPALGTFEVAGALPLGPFDRQRVLVLDSSGARCNLLGELCQEQEEDLQALLGTDPLTDPDTDPD
ncbi:MAG: LON peptidase substrate-binding domain-containing protein [Acidimicrobiales bacterium]